MQNQDEFNLCFIIYLTKTVSHCTKNQNFLDKRPFYIYNCDKTNEIVTNISKVFIAKTRTEVQYEYLLRFGAGL